MSRRQTGFSPLVRSLVYDRCSGRCEICDVWASDLQLHHRRARGAGSTRRPETNYPSNCLALCQMDHHRVESHRALAYDNGWLVRQSHDPATIPVLRRGVRVVLDDQGGFRPAEEAA